MTARARKIALICFIGYAVLLAVLGPLTVAGHMAHGDSFQQAPLSLWLQIVDWLLIAIGFPLVPAVTATAEAMTVHLSALQYLVLYLSNGICIAYFASSAHLWRTRRKAESACPRFVDTGT
jgi:hypothetical protein